MTSSNERSLNDEAFHALMEYQRRVLSMVQHDEAVEFQEHKSRMFTEGQRTDYKPPVNIMIPSGLQDEDNPTRRTQTPAFQLSPECAFEEQPFEKYIVFDAHEEPKITRRIFDEEGDELPLKKRRLSMDTASLTSFEGFEGVEDEDEQDDGEDDDAHKIEDSQGAFTISEMPCDATTVSRDEKNDWMKTSTSSSSFETSSIWREGNLPANTTAALPSCKSREAFQKMMLKSTKSQRQIQDWERRVVGLRRSHSQTMRNSTKTRRALLKNLFSA